MLISVSPTDCDASCNVTPYHYDLNESRSLDCRTEARAAKYWAIDWRHQINNSCWQWDQKRTTRWRSHQGDTKSFSEDKVFLSTKFPNGLIFFKRQDFTFSLLYFLNRDNLSAKNFHRFAIDRLFNPSTSHKN